jgi:hypothetical protein
VKFGCTAISEAANRGHFEIMQLLFAHPGLDVKIAYEVCFFLLFVSLRFVVLIKLCLV